MKKTFYGLFLTFIFLIGINNVKADNKVCYYSGEDGKLEFSVYVNSDGKGTAKLIKAYGDSEGFRENQDAGAIWEVKDVVEDGNCKKYLRYRMSLGNNKFDFSNSKFNNVIPPWNYQLENVNKYNEQIVNESDYSHVRCEYNFNLGYVIFDVKSQGNGLVKFDTITQLKENDKNLILNFDNIVIENFKKGSNLVCPKTLFYERNKGVGGSSPFLKFSFENNKNYSKNEIELMKEYNNNKKLDDDLKGPNSSETTFECYVPEDSDYSVEVDKEKKELKYKYNGKYMKYYSSLLKFSDFKKNDKFFCPRIKVVKSTITEFKLDNKKYDDDGKDAEELEQDRNLYLGKRYKELLGSIKIPLQSRSKNLNKYKLIVNNNTVTFSSIDSNTILCEKDECQTNSLYYLEKGVRNVRSYCNDIYRLFSKNAGSNELKSRYEECKNFEKEFYPKLVEDGVIGDMTSDCSIITPQMQEVIEKILTIIKIVAPIAAIALGTVDFIKAIANNDADKEMKAAFVKLLKRLLAAVILFLLPFILTFLMDLFLKTKSGYNSDNPFCIDIGLDK